ncbi:MAG: chemotaxis protein CheV [Desulfovibrionaceae bacterium]|nr:chemotaxis protein CheV [Desulfovibrionaceae bacterium]
MSQTNILLESGTNELELVEFYIDEEDNYRGHYGVNVSKVVEIIRTQPITVMPNMRHESVLGAFQYRNGRIVPLIDLAKYLKKPSAENKEPKIIVTEFNNVLTAFLVSGVNRIHRLSWEQVEPPGAFIQNMSNAITGVVKLEGRTAFVLDMEKIVGDMDEGLSISYSHPENLQSENVYTILHADDSQSVRGLVKHLMEESKVFSVVQATNGSEAWDYLLGLKKRSVAEGMPITSYLQGVITDIEMPSVDGLTLCRWIKEDHVLKALPVALFSSLVTNTLLHKGESVGADAQFSKPELSQLSQRMVELIKELK